jgi:hypothetical protein
MPAIRLRATGSLGLTGFLDATITPFVPAYLGTYNAELPRTRFEPPYVARTGTVRTVNSGGDVQAALDAANPGDVIVLESGAVFSGTFNIPTNKSGGVGGDIYIVSSAIHGGSFDTPVGTRKTTDAGLATLRHPGTGAVNVINTTGNGRTGWRLCGVRLDVPSGYTGTALTSMVQLGDVTQTTSAAYPGRFAFDRCRLFGRPLAQIRRAIWVTGPDFYFGDGEIGDIVTVNTGDCQGILITHAASNVTITNHAIGGPTESVVVGGLDSNIIPSPLVIPHDVTVERGHHFCYAYQDPNDGAWNSLVYNTKNLGECKGGVRQRWHAMVLTRHLGKDQQFALTMKGGGQAGQATAAASDIIVQNIKLVDCSAGVQVKGFSNVGGGNSIQRVLIKNLALFGYNPTTLISPRVLELTDYADQIEMDRVTAILGSGDNTSMIITDPSGSGRMADVRVTNSILGAQYGMAIPGNVDAGLSSLITGDRIISGNALIGKSSGTYPQNTGGLYPANVAGVGFTSYADSAADNLLLASGSALKGAGVGGIDPGCDIPVLLAATAGCVSGSW